MFHFIFILLKQQLHFFLYNQDITLRTTYYVVVGCYAIVSVPIQHYVTQVNA